MEAGRYHEALNRLADLREPVDAFFDQVLVMAEDAAIRDNRIALLNELSSLFLRVADFSKLQDQAPGLMVSRETGAPTLPEGST